MAARPGDISKLAINVWTLHVRTPCRRSQLAAFLPQFTLTALVMESGSACIPLANCPTSLSLLGTLVPASPSCAKRVTSCNAHGRVRAGGSSRLRPRRSLRKSLAAKLRHQSAPIASSLPRREPVVTMRKMPLPTRTYRWLAQLRPHVMGSLTHRYCDRAMRSVSLPALRGRRFKKRALRATPEPWVNGSSRWTDFPQEAPSPPMPRAAAASSKQTAQIGCGVPSPL